jgi:hypothetical protein
LLKEIGEIRHNFGKGIFMNKKKLRITQVSLAILLSVIAGFSWMLPAEVKVYESVVMTFSFIGTGLGISLLVGDRWRTHWLTGTIVIMLAPAFLMQLGSIIPALMNFIRFPDGKVIEFLSYFIVFIIVAAISAPYILLPRYRNVWVGLLVWILQVTPIIYFHKPVLYLGYINVHLLMLATFVSVAVGMWWKSGEELDNSEQGIIGQLTKINRYSSAIKLHPSMLLLLVFIGVLFGAAWYREYDHNRDYALRAEEQKAKYEMSLMDSLQEMKDTTENDTSTIYYYHSDVEGEFIRMYHLNENDFETIYGAADELLFRRPGDRSFVSLEEQNSENPTTQRAHLYEFMHELQITQVTEKGFDFTIQTAATPGSCSVSGKARMVSMNTAQVVSFENEYLVPYAKDTVDFCDLTFLFYKNGVVLEKNGCLGACGAYAGMGDVYVLDKFSGNDQ